MHTTSENSEMLRLKDKKWTQKTSLTELQGASTIPAGESDQKIKVLLKRLWEGN
jgi:hypothetical protein